MVFGSVLVVVYLYGKTTYDLRFHEFVVYVCTDQNSDFMSISREDDLLIYLR
jgi:hypothetical protein